MSKPVKRQYRSSLRDEQARLTRARIRDAATDLFVEQGYAGTSIAAIAARAEVAPQTVFTTFGTKAALLAAAIDVALAGDDRPVPLADRMPAADLVAAGSSAEAASALARGTTGVLQRAGRLIQVADAAAQQDRELEPLWQAGHRGRLADMGRIARAFGDAGLLRPGVTVELATDLLWTLTSPATYGDLTRIQGWSARRYERWLAEAVERLLLR